VIGVILNMVKIMIDRRPGTHHALRSSATTIPRTMNILPMHLMHIILTLDSYNLHSAHSLTPQDKGPPCPNSGRAILTASGTRLAPRQIKHPTIQASLLD